MPERLARGVRKMTDSHEHENHQVTASSVTDRYVKSRVNNSPAATMGSTNPMMPTREKAGHITDHAVTGMAIDQRAARTSSCSASPSACFGGFKLELYVGMICGSIPTLRPLVLRWQRKDSKDEKYLRPSKSSAIKLDSYGKPSPKVSLGAKSRYSITKSEKAFMPQRRKNIEARKGLCLSPKTFELKDGFREVTVLQLSRSVDRLAWWLEECIGRSSTFETIAYLGLPDLRYTIVILAAVKCGVKVS
ncbi:MAG: hypothetical protein Q9196_003913 [Gyalolechia fulgens]